MRICRPWSRQTDRVTIPPTHRGASRGDRASAPITSGFPGSGERPRMGITSTSRRIWTDSQPVGGFITSLGLGVGAGVDPTPPTCVARGVDGTGTLRDIQSVNTHPPHITPNTLPKSPQHTHFTTSHSVTHTIPFPALFSPHVTPKTTPRGHPKGGCILVYLPGKIL